MYLGFWHTKENKQIVWRRGYLDNLEIMPESIQLTNKLLILRLAIKIIQYRNYFKYAELTAQSKWLYGLNNECSNKERLTYNFWVLV